MKPSHIFAIVALGVAAPAIAGERKDRATNAAVKWGQCVFTRSEKFAIQPEPAETLVTAAMGGCIAEAADFRHLLREATREYGLSFSTPADDETISRMYDQVEQQIKNAAIARIIEARANSTDID